VYGCHRGCPEKARLGWTRDAFEKPQLRGSRSKTRAARRGTERLASYLPPARLAQRARALVHRDRSATRRWTRSTRRARRPHCGLRGRGEAVLMSS
jgi:hypothetical protein